MFAEWVNYFLYIKIELIKKQPIGKSLTLNYHIIKILLCLCIISDKNVALPAKGLSPKTIKVCSKRKELNKLESSHLCQFFYDTFHSLSDLIVFVLH